MTNFSSRGPLGDWIKPDVTAPGMEILAGTTPDPHDDAVFSGPPGQYFQAIAGTSMSSPHAAGVSALVKAAHPNWTPGQVKSALMTSSVQSVLKEDGATRADPFDRGAGSIRANRAVEPTVTFDVTTAEYVAAAATDALGRIHVNTPSINAPTMPGIITTTRTMTNVSGRSRSSTPGSRRAAGASISVRRASSSSGGRDGHDRDPDRRHVPGRRPVLRPDHPRSGARRRDARRAAGCILQAAGGGDAHDTPATRPRSGRVDRRLRGGRDEHRIRSPRRRPLREAFEAGARLQKPTGAIRRSRPGRRSDGLELERDAVAGARSGGRGRSSRSTRRSSAISRYVDVGVAPAGPASATRRSRTTACPELRFGAEVYDEIGITSNGYVVVGGGDADDIELRPADVARPGVAEQRPGSVLDRPEPGRGRRDPRSRALSAHGNPATSSPTGTTSPTYSSSADADPHERRALLVPGLDPDRRTSAGEEQTFEYGAVPGSW